MKLLIYFLAFFPISFTARSGVTGRVMGEGREGERREGEKMEGRKKGGGGG